MNYSYFNMEKRRTLKVKKKKKKVRKYINERAKKTIHTLNKI